MTRRTLISYLVFFWCSMNCHAKTNLQEIWDLSTELIHKGIFNDSSQVYSHQLETIQQMEKPSSILSTAEFVLQLSSGLSRERNYQTAITYLTETLHLITPVLPDNSQEGQIILVNLMDELGSVYHTVGLNNQSMDIYFKALVIAERYHLDSQIAVLYNNVASLYLGLNQYRQADSLYRKAIEINESKNDAEKLFINYNNLSVIYARQLQYEKALEYAFLALHLLKKKTDEDVIFLMKRNIGSIYLKRGELSLAKEQISEVIAYQENKRQESHLITSYGILAEIESRLDQTDSAARLIEKALALAGKYHEKSTESELLKKKAALLKESGKYEQALLILSQVLQIRDSLRIQEGQSRVQSLANLIMEEEQQHQKQLQIQDQREKEKKTNTSLYLLTRVLDDRYSVYLLLSDEQMEKEYLPYHEEDYRGKTGSPETAV